MTSIRSNIVYSFLYQLLTILLPLLTIPYLSRVLGATGIGQFSYVNSVTNYFIMFIMLGLSNYGNRTIAKSRDDIYERSKNFINIYSMQLITSVLVLIIYVIYSIYQNNILVYIQVISIISCFFDISWFYFGMEEFKLTVTRNTLIKIIGTLFIFILVKDKADVWIYTLIMSLSTFFSTFVLMLFLKNRIVFIRPSWKEIIKHIKPNLVLFVPVISVSIYKIMDKIMLGNISSFQEVGYYENTERVLNIPMCIITALGSVMLPRISNLMSNNRLEQCKDFFVKSILFVSFLSSASVFGLIAIAEPFVEVFFGSGFEKCIDLFQILLPSILFISFANVIRTQYLIPFQKDSVYIKSVILGAIVNFIINYILIPEYASIGAAFGTFVAEFLVCFYQAYSIRKEINISKCALLSIPFVLFSISMMFVLNCIDVNVSNILIIFIKVLIGCVYYCILSLLYLIVLKKKRVL